MKRITLQPRLRLLAEMTPPGGRLADIAPTILDVMGLAAPEEMDGQTLIVK